MTTRRTSRIRVPAVCLSVAISLTGCAAGGVGSDDDDRPQIVASTDVYGSIASSIAGDLADVSSIVSGPAQDPHSYEASASDQLTMSRADLIIENGGGYDPFIDVLLNGLGESEATVVNASEESGLLKADASDHEGGAEDEAEGEEHGHIDGFNEHVWYSLEAVDAIAAQIANELSALDPTNATVYAGNYDDFSQRLGDLEERATGLAGRSGGARAAVTEPVPLYLLADAGLVDATPAEFSEAIEEGTDVPPAVLLEVLDLVSDRSVAVLAYNSQTAGPETEQVREAAEAEGIPVVEFTETLPEGDDYLGWMSSNLDALDEVL